MPIVQDDYVKKLVQSYKSENGKRLLYPYSNHLFFDPKVWGVKGHGVISMLRGIDDNTDIINEYEIYRHTGRKNKYLLPQEKQE